jgi:hypothetical protein
MTKRMCYRGRVVTDVQLALQGERLKKNYDIFSLFPVRTLVQEGSKRVAGSNTSTKSPPVVDKKCAQISSR